VAGVRRRDALEHDIARHPAAADCGLDTESLSLFRRSVDAINAASGPTAGSLPGTVPTDANPDRRPAGDVSPVGE
jgi:hypothetical protein